MDAYEKLFNTKPSVFVLILVLYQIFYHVSDSYFFRIVCSILIGHNDILKISDFGTSKEFHEHERSMTMSFAGTYAWMPPEVIKNEPCSEKVDIW